MKKHYRLIILVYSAETHILYKFMKKVWLSYFDSSADIKVFFCYGAKSGLGAEEHDLVYEDLPESNIGGIRKVLRAMEHIDQHYTFDFFLRTNLSTFWDFTALLKRLNTLPKNRCLTGTATNYPYLLKEDNEEDRRLLFGYDMIFSYDVFQQLLAKRNEIYPVAYHPLVRYLADDIILSIYLLKVLKLSSISSIPFGLYIEKGSKELFDGEKPIMRKIYQAIDSARDKNIDHFRIKTNKDLRPRIGVDDKILRYLCKLYYNKDLNFAIVGS